MMIFMIASCHDSWQLEGSAKRAPRQGSDDEEFLSALEAMPAAGGIALGVDRLIMVLLGEEDIRRVTAFPADSFLK